MLLRLAAVHLLASAAFATAAAPAQTAKPQADVVFDHLEGKARIFQVHVRDGQKLTVHIERTCPAAFEYPYIAVQPGVVRSAIDSTQLDSKDLEIVHDKRFGGYVVSIEAIAGKSPAALCGAQAAQLKPVSFIISVLEDDWNLSFSGGFTISGLKNPVYYADQASTVQEDEGKEDAARLGAAAFVHVGHDAFGKWGLHPALAFGLGINADNRAEYLVGLGLRLGDKATVNGGLTWGSVARLPNGVSVGATVADEAILTDLPTRTGRGWFFAITYSFIDTKDKLLKPFASPPPSAKPGQ